MAAAAMGLRALLAACGADWQRLTPEQQVKLGAGSLVMVAPRGFMFQPANKR